MRRCRRGLKGGVADYLQTAGTPTLYCPAPPSTWSIDEVTSIVRLSVHLADRVRVTEQSEQ